MEYILYICTKTIPMRNKYTKELLEPIVKDSSTWAEVCRKMGVEPMTGSQSHLKKRAVDFGIDFSHFLGQAHNRGKQFKKKAAIEYCYNGSNEPSDRLKKKLIRDGYKEAECEVCGLSEWRGQPIVLELDHKDSNHSNNELDNLQILCPNCHAQETRNRKMPK